MKLEDAIQQKTFKSQEQKLAINLLYTSNWLQYQYNQFFKEVDLTTQQFNVLRILRGQHPNYCSLKTIKERMLDRMSDASRIVDKLVTKGLVVRHECPNDRRSVNLLISEEGLKLLKSLDVIEEQMKDIFSTLSANEVKELNRLLDKLRDKE
ncbi:MAG: MarR family transcriptional regulator [Bacteroidia bacterium]|nr:MarR family transcriptional regulator [Bacteroidia bacterium]